MISGFPNFARDHRCSVQGAAPVVTGEAKGGGERIQGCWNASGGHGKVSEGLFRIRGTRSSMTREVFRLSPLLLVILIDTIGYSIIVPVLAPVLIDDQPTMMASYSAHARYIVYGVAIGVYDLVMLYMAPVLGEISDRAGRRPVLVLSIVGIILSFLMIGFSMAANLVFRLAAQRFHVGRRQDRARPHG